MKGRAIESRESHFNKAVPPLREAYLLTLPHGEDEDGVGGADRGSLAHVVPRVPFNVGTWTLHGQAT